jgi:zinc protease
MIKNFKLFFIAFLVVGSYLTVYSQVEGIKKITEVEGLTEYQIEKNGMKVILFPDNSKPTITVNITYLVGSRFESYGETGMAHLLEHMVFKGTPNHSNIPQELTSHGARANGTTWLDRTNYFETFNATDENLDWALSMESDRMVNSYIAKKDLESEMTVVRNEFEQGENDPSSILNERVLSTAYLWHNYGKSTIGARSDIENVPIERLQAFYHKYYQPDNSVLIVTGKIDVNKTLNLINKYFGAIPAPDRSGSNFIYPTYTREPVQDGERMVTLKRVGDKQVLMAAYHICQGSHEDFVPLDMLASILTDDPSGILYKKLTKTKKASFVYGYPFSLKEPGVMLFGSEVPLDKSLDEAKDILLSTLDSIKYMTFTQEDLDRQKQRSMKGWTQRFNNVESIGTTLSEYIALGDWRLLFKERDNIEKVTLDDIKRVAQKYFKPSNRTVGLFVPDKTPDRVDIDNNIDVAAMMNDYKGKAKVAAGEDFDASPDNIDARTSTVKEKNGIEMALLPKQTRGNQVTANLTFRIGNLEKLKGMSTIGDLTGSMLNKGTKTKTKQEVQDAFDKLKASVRVNGGATSFSVSITTTKENLIPTIALVREVLRDPVFPENEFEVLKTQEVSGLEEGKSDPNTLASLTFRRILAPYPKDDPRYTPTIEESISDINAVTLDQVKKFYKDFYGASDATFSVVGDFDKDAVQKELNKDFGDWKNKTPYKRISSEFKPIAAQDKSINTPDKANSLYLSGIPIKIKDTDPDYPALVLANEIMGGGFLNSRLATRIRQKEGLSYGVGSNISVPAQDDNGLFMIYAISAPENTAKVKACAKEEIDRAMKDGFTKDEIAAAKESYLQQQKVSLAQDSRLAGMLNSNLYLNRTMKFKKDLMDKINNLTEEQVNAACKKYIDSGKLITIMAGDFDAKKESKP